MSQNTHRNPSRVGVEDFTHWLRVWIKAKKVTQRQLAQQSGVDHSTISRLLRGERMPSLGTATKLANALGSVGDFDGVGSERFSAATTSRNPTAGVEYALRADDLLSEADVRQVMQYYLAMRPRRHPEPGASHS